MSHENQMSNDVVIIRVALPDATRVRCEVPTAAMNHELTIELAAGGAR